MADQLREFRFRTKLKTPSVLFGPALSK